MTVARPIRVLHVVGGMDRGGIETWLMHILRNVDSKRFHMDFLVETSKEYAYNEEVRSLGSKVIPCLEPKKPRKYAANFRKAYNENGPYDIVHSHNHHFSGFVLHHAHKANVPVRIAHSHNDRTELESHAGLLRHLYLRLAKRLIRQHSTVGLAVSEKAAISLYGDDWQSDRRWQLLYCGIDLSPFSARVDSNTLRALLGLPNDAFVVGHVGRFVEAKNHAFLIDIFVETLRLKPNAHLLLIGEGPLLPLIRKRVDEAGLTGKVSFGGSRSDVPQLMGGVMDALVMPSLHEGLPLVGLEAQAAGIPLIISDTVTKELNIVEASVTRVELTQPARIWAEALCRRSSSLNPEEALRSVGKSPFNIANSLASLERIYQRAYPHAA